MMLLLLRWFATTVVLRQAPAYVLERTSAVVVERPTTVETGILVEDPAGAATGVVGLLLLLIVGCEQLLLVGRPIAAFTGHFLGDELLEELAVLDRGRQDVLEAGEIAARVVVLDALGVLAGSAGVGVDALVRAPVLGSDVFCGIVWKKEPRLGFSLFFRGEGWLCELVSAGLVEEA